MGGSSAILQAMMGGQFDIGGVGGGDVAPAPHRGRRRGDDRHLHGGVPPRRAWTEPEIRTIADLRGKTLGVTQLGSSSHYATIAMLAAGGLRSDDATMIQTGGVGESMAALLSGNIDGAMLGFPQNLEARKAGYRTLANLQDAGRLRAVSAECARRAGGLAARAGESWRSRCRRCSALTDALALAKGQEWPGGAGRRCVSTRRSTTTR